MADLLPGTRWVKRPSAVRQEELLHALGVTFEHHVGAAQVADLLFRPLYHAVALAALGIEHLAGAADIEALFCARLGLQLGHLALLTSRAASNARGGFVI